MIVPNFDLLLRNVTRMAKNNLININQIKYRPKKHNDKVLVSTETEKKQY